MYEYCFKHFVLCVFINSQSWDPSVTVDMEMVLNHLVPESLSYKHTCEGADDMPAHAKQALLGGPSITVPITNGQLALGTWQGIWLCEHRNSGYLIIIDPIYENLTHFREDYDYDLIGNAISEYGLIFS
ncbi:hypothetical protein EWB00_010432 [Schistosoma japonicum]|uniref:Uncharacterized protein n=1 Tax=Schistosoma japonicum TaxID=6182 RepID=A0A4Z2DXU4_SCHJA|nr:hypothetical protein EWB00_010432 [Schistosoma japonicum]